MNNPVIAIPCFKKPEALKRLLSSLKKAKYPADVKIVFSVDYSGDDDAFNIVEAFEWPYGDKEIIRYDKNIGLRENILNCGKLSQKYGSVIILEDDIYVSKDFYSYAVRAQDFYSEDDNIAGISLYAYEYSEINQERFDPLYDGKDTFFMQWASSWGQLWTANHWKKFYRWYQLNKEKSLACFNIPQNVIEWPESSWKKYYIAYLYDKKKFFVYPYVSFVSNCGDAGIHGRQGNFLNTQVCIPQFYKTSSIDFADFSLSLVKYDAFFQIYSDLLKKMNERIRAYDFDVDIAGTKKEINIEKEYLLSPKKCKKPILAFDYALIPLALNVINDIEGEYLFFGKVLDFEMKEGLFYNVFRWSVNRSIPSGLGCLKYVFVKILKKIRIDKK